jgi:hypothetical protein
MGAPGSPSAPPRGLAVDIFSVDGGRSRMSGTTSLGAHRRRFLALMVGASGSLSPPPTGATVDILQVSGSHSQTFWQRLPGGNYEQDVFQ